MVNGINQLEPVIRRWRELAAEAELLSTRLLLGPPVSRSEVSERLAEYSRAMLMGAGIAESTVMMFQEAVFLQAMRDPEEPA